MDKQIEEVQMTRFLRQCLNCGHALSGRFGRAVRAMNGCCEGRGSTKTVKAPMKHESSHDDALWIMMRKTMGNMFRAPWTPAPSRTLKASDAFELNA